MSYDDDGHAVTLTPTELYDVDDVPLVICDANYGESNFVAACKTTDDWTFGKDLGKGAYSVVKQATFKVTSNVFIIQPTGDQFALKIIDISALEKEVDGEKLLDAEVCLLIAVIF